MTVRLHGVSLQKPVEDSMKRKTGKIILWCAIVLWMAVIFAFSAQNAESSTDTSDGVVDRVVEEMFGTADRNIVPDSVRLAVSFIVRKAAHFASYFLLGSLCAGAFLSDTRRLLVTNLYALGLSFAYAVSDEIHQLFVPGRAGRLLDVGIDTAGALCGILVFCAVLTLVKRVRKNRGENL